ncbi:MAG: glycine cleavage system aminomethyltransferase GcvT, partial [Quisquiliibacterium sp.]
MLVNLGQEVRMVVNAGNRDEDFAELVRRCPGLTFEWVDAALIALQGPAAERALCRLDPQAEQMLFMQARTLSLLGAPCFTTRSGYTGEDGFEVALPEEEARRFAEKILADERVIWIGLAARDSLRLEA